MPEVVLTMKDDERIGVCKFKVEFDWMATDLDIDMTNFRPARLLEICTYYDDGTCTYCRPIQPEEIYLWMSKQKNT